MKEAKIIDLETKKTVEKMARYLEKYYAVSKCIKTDFTNWGLHSDLWAEAYELSFTLNCYEVIIYPYNIIEAFNKTEKLMWRVAIFEEGKDIDLCNHTSIFKDCFTSIKEQSNVYTLLKIVLEKIGPLVDEI